LANSCSGRRAQWLAGAAIASLHRGLTRPATSARRICWGY
jgi:hypothetical protein